MNKHVYVNSHLSFQSDVTNRFRIDDSATLEDWQFEHPVWDTKLCIRCGACYLICPDAAIYKNSEGYFNADLKRCKGCGICARECWTGAVSLQLTAQRPPWLTKNY